MDPKRANKEARCSKMGPNFMKIHAKSDQNPSKSIPNPSLERGPEKTRKIRKSDAPDSSPAFRFWTKSRPKWHPKIINKSTPKKYAKMMAKGAKRDGKWSRNGIQNHEKSIQKLMSKNNKKIMSNLGNHGFSLRKTYNSQKSRFTN